MKHEDAKKVVPVERLRLDRRNPRLVEQADEDEDSIIAKLYRSAELQELLQSMSANGYLDIEPLVVVRESGHGDAFTVLEGNRRLAALRLLRDPSLVERLASSKNLRIPVPEVNGSLRQTFNQVSVHCVASRNEARPFLGFKHINGPAKWNAYAKARFAASWYKSGRSEGVTLRDIANSIGDRHDTIKRMVFAIYVLEQAERHGLFHVEHRHTAKFNFSHLYTALARLQYMEYLGLKPGWTQYDPKPDQIPEDKLDELRKILVWIYGWKPEDIRPVVKRQNPDIRRLGHVLSHPEALHVLEETRRLDAAHSSTKSVGRRFSGSLVRAREEIQTAWGSLRAYDGWDRALLDIAEDVKVSAASLHMAMSKKREQVTGDSPLLGLPR